MLFMNFFKHFIGKDFHDGLNVVPILLMANIFLGVVFNLSFWYKVANKTRIGIWITGAGAVITLGINMAFVPTYGYVACAWATLACYVLMSVLSYILCQKYYGIPYKIGTLACYFVLAIAFYFINNNLSIDSATISYSIKALLMLVFIGVTCGNEYRLVKKEKISSVN